MRGDKMICYSFFPGDFRRDTSHLSDLEELYYRRLIDHYMMTEKPLPREIDRIKKIALSPHKKSIEALLQNFFYLQEDGYHNLRCDKELARIYEVSASRRLSAKKRWKNKDANASANASANAMQMDMQTGMQNGCKRNAIHIHNHKEEKEKVIIQKESPKIESFVLPDDFPPEEWDDWMKARKGKKASNSERAKNILIRKIREIVSKNPQWTIKEIIETALIRGWSGIEESWILNTGGKNVGANGQRRLTFAEIDERNQQEARRKFLMLGEEPTDQDVGESSILDIGKENADD